MVGADEPVDPARVARAAQALLAKYGDQAYSKALLLERATRSTVFAAAVSVEVARQLGISTGKS